MQMQILNIKLNVKYFCVCRANECVTRTLYRSLPIIITTAIQNEWASAYMRIFIPDDVRTHGGAPARVCAYNGGLKKTNGIAERTAEETAAGINCKDGISRRYMWKCKVQGASEDRRWRGEKKRRVTPRGEWSVMRDREYMRSDRRNGGEERGNNSLEQVQQNRSRLRALLRRIYSPSDRQ